MVFEFDWDFETSRRKNRVYVYNLAWIPVYEVQDDQVWVYLDYRISKFVLKVVKEFSEWGVDFLFISPKFSNPKFRRFIEKHDPEDPSESYSFTSNRNLRRSDRDLDFHYQNLFEYLGNLKIISFYYGFQKIGFDFTQNLVKYLHKFNCFSYQDESGETRFLIKEILDHINGDVQSNWTMTGHRIVEWSVPDEDIRERYNNLWREIKLYYLDEIL
jgi:hypothetical protein